MNRKTHSTGGPAQATDLDGAEKELKSVIEFGGDEFETYLCTAPNAETQHARAAVFKDRRAKK